MKKFIRNILAKTGAGAPKPPKRITLDRNGGIDIDLREGQHLLLWLKPDSMEIRAFAGSNAFQDEFVGTSHNYALARYIMQFGNPPVRIYAFSYSEITVDILYGKERHDNFEPEEDDDFV